MARILVIDDDMLTRTLVATILQQEHEVITAENGADGLSAARDKRPDLVICDISMPDMDGFAVFEAWGSDPELSPVPFIFLSAISDNHVVRRGMKLGAVDYLTKPLTVVELRQAVEKQLTQLR